MISNETVGDSIINLETRERVRVVRVYPWNLKTADEILTALKRKEQPSFIEINMAVKSDASVISQGMIAPIGGGMLDDETVLKGAYRETQEETTLHTVPYSVNSYVYTAKDTYSYQIPFGKYANQDREVSVVSIPSISTQIESAYPTNLVEDKIDRIINLSIDELEELQKKGQSKTGKLIEGSILFDSPNIQMSRRESVKKAKALNGLIAFFRETDSAIGKRIQDNLENKLVKKGVVAEDGQDLLPFYRTVSKFLEEEEAKNFLRAAIDEVRAEVYSDYFRANEEATIGNEISSIKSEQEMEAGLQALGLWALSLKKTAQLMYWRDLSAKVGMRYVKKAEIRAVDEAAIIRMGLNGGNYGVDMLHLLTLLTQTESAGARTTATALAVQNFLIDTFVVSAISNNLDPDEMFKKIISRDQSPGEMTEILKKMNQSFIEFTAKAFGEHPGYVRSVLREVERFMPDFGELVKVNDPSLSYLYQAHEERNEVKDAYLPELCALVYYHPDPLVKFEAGRKLLIFLKALLCKKTYDRKREEGSKFHSLAINYFFGPVVPGQTHKIKGEGLEHVVAVRSNSNRSEDPFVVLVDRKPDKSFESFLRKSFEENPEDINDIVSYGIAFLKLPRNMPQRTPVERIESVQSITEDFLQYLKNQGYDVNIKDDKNTYGFFQDALEGDKAMPAGTGKRTGSKGNYILRRKFNSTASKDDARSGVEIGIYPFVNFTDPAVRKLGFMTWEDKDADDKAYALRRVLEPLKGTEGLRSVYGGFFPPFLYNMLLIVQPKKKRKS